MNPKVKKFLHENRIAVLSIVDLEGFPHSATLHYAINNDLLELYFMTSKESHKVQTLLNGEIVHASVVIGFSEKEWITVQMEGDVHLALLPVEKTRSEIAFYMKFPKAERGKHIVSLIFKPLFWKYTNYSQKPWEIITSQDTA